jgi:uncharacterized protein (TIGR03437 family)
VFTIGGVPAQVQFAGLNVTPGEFQFNVRSGAFQRPDVDPR